MSKFFKFILRITLYLIIIVIIFTGLSLWRGGDWIRYAGNIIYKASEEAARTSDSIYNSRKSAERFCGKVKRKITAIFKKDGDTDKGR
ncbi:MAG: hypothetical protein N2257_01580 [Thermodesulfovibrionales bacterium]|nr:hypothetical protein [Thermodesulfovibrionales bacterium]